MDQTILGALRRARVTALLGSCVALGCGAEDPAKSGDTGPGGTDRRGIGLELAIARATSTPDAEGVGKAVSALSLPVPFPILDWVHP